MKTLLKLLLISSIVFNISCKRDNDDPENPHEHNEEELITTVQLLFTDVSGSTINVTWKDVDGPGGTDPVIDSILLDTNSTYNVSIEFLDESGEETVDVTHEVEEEAGEHLICFETSTNLVAIERTDSDGKHEIGLSSKWTTTTASDGSVTISLKHQPDVKDGTCTPGDTDVEVTFPLVIN